MAGSGKCHSALAWLMLELLNKSEIVSLSLAAGTSLRAAARLF